ncbi:hypothetical protein MAPG_09390, partial [Magnaporthiopsis poae ATCC 64411]
MSTPPSLVRRATALNVSRASKFSWPVASGQTTHISAVNIASMDPSPMSFSAAAAASRCEAVACRIVATRADVDETLLSDSDDAASQPHRPHLALLADEMRTFGAVANSLTVAVPRAAVIAPALQTALTRSLDDAETAWAVADKQLRRLRAFDTRAWTADAAVLEDYEMLLQAGMAVYELFRELLGVADAVRQTSALKDGSAQRLLASFAEACQVVLRRRDVLVAKNAPPPSPALTDPGPSPTAIAGPAVKLTKTKSGGGGGSGSTGGAGFLNGLTQSLQAMTANFRYKPEPLVSALCQSAARGDLQQVRGFIEQGAKCGRTQRGQENSAHLRHRRAARGDGAVAGRARGRQRAGQGRRQQ